MIAGYGRFRVPAATPAPDPVRAELAEIPAWACWPTPRRGWIDRLLRSMACRRQPSAEIGVGRQQLESPTIRARTRKAIAFLQAEPAELDQLRDRLVQDDPALAEGERLPRTMPGCGKASGRTAA